MDKKQVYPVAMLIASGSFIFLQWRKVLTQPAQPTDVISPGQTQVLLIVCGVVWVLGVGMYLVAYFRGRKLD